MKKLLSLLLVAGIPAAYADMSHSITSSVQPIQMSAKSTGRQVRQRAGPDEWTEEKQRSRKSYIFWFVCITWDRDVI